MNFMFERLDLLIGEDKRKKLNDKNILIVGLGGVGGACFEALVRLGIGKFTVIDNDTFDETNLNRQILSNLNVMGMNKVDVAKNRALSINQNIKVESKCLFIDNNTIKTIDFSKYDYIIDCCDTVTAKILLIKSALQYNKKIIVSCGTGNRVDPTKLIITDIFKTNYDPLAKVMRKLLRESNINAKIPVITSTEIPIKTHQRVVASNSLVPNVAGFYLASFVFNDIISNKE